MLNGEELNGFMLINISRDATGTITEASVFNLSKSARECSISVEINRVYIKFIFQIIKFIFIMVIIVY